MSTVVIGGRTIKTSGGSVSIVGNRVYVDGKEISDGEVKEPVKLIVEGNAMNVSTEGKVEVNGSVLGKVEAGYSITCNGVGESVNAGGNVKCGNVGGNVKANGNVTCENVKGDVKANGSINYS